MIQSGKDICILTKVKTMFSFSPAAICDIYIFSIHKDNYGRYKEDIEELKKRLNELIDLEDWTKGVKIVNCLDSCTKGYVLDKLYQRMQK